MTFWLMTILASVAVIFGGPILFIAIGMAWAWYDNLLDRLDLAARRFRARYGWD